LQAVSEYYRGNVFERTNTSFTTAGNSVEGQNVYITKTNTDNYDYTKHDGCRYFIQKFIIKVKGEGKFVPVLVFN
jgi:hypothetical protein